jgi:hypothetical protein
MWHDSNVDNDERAKRERGRWGFRAAWTSYDVDGYGKYEEVDKVT